MIPRFYAVNLYKKDTESSMIFTKMKQKKKAAYETGRRL